MQRKSHPLQAATESLELPSLAAMALVFLKLGTIAFGGPASHIAMMESEFVTRRAWLTHAQFLDRLAAANLLPGPSSTELALFIGYDKRGWRGLLIAGLCFILPAVIIVLLLAMAYVRCNELPQMTGILYAIKPVVISVIIQAFWKLSQTAFKTKWLSAIGMIAAFLFALQLPALAVLFAAAILASIPAMYSQRQRANSSVVVFALPIFGPMLLVISEVVKPAGLWRIFLGFAKIGAVLFGSGYVLLAFLRTDLVDHLHWLTEQQLLDAIAIGQITPGPVFTTATFIGYILAGTPGALAATLGIFAPAFFFVSIGAWLIPKLRRSQIAGSILDGVVVASLALMGVVAWQLGRAAIVDIPSAIIATLCTALLLSTKLNSAWLIAAAALFGWLY